MHYKTVSGFALASVFIAPMPGATGETVVSPASADRLSFIGQQAPSEARVSKLIGLSVTNKAGETVGDVSDVVVGDNGQASVVIIGVGGFLGVGEKNVGVPFSALKLAKDNDGKRTATLDATKAQLDEAPAFAGEKTTFEKIQDGAADAARTAQQKAKELMKAL